MDHEAHRKHVQADDRWAPDPDDERREREQDERVAGVQDADELARRRPVGELLADERLPGIGQGSEESEQDGAHQTSR
jgi:hypothetical protein